MGVKENRPIPIAITSAIMPKRAILSVLESLCVWSLAIGAVYLKMERNLKRLIFTASLLFIGGCQVSPVYYHKHPAKQVVVLDEKEISVLALGEDRWEAFGKPQGSSPQAQEQQQLRQVKAIEIVSGCLVLPETVSMAAKPGLLTAQVQCAKK